MRAFVNLSGIDYELDVSGVSDCRIVNNTGYDIPANTAIYYDYTQPDKLGFNVPDGSRPTVIDSISKEDADVLIFQAKHGSNFQKAICRAVLACLESMTQK